MVEIRVKKSLINATKYIFKVLFNSQDKHHSIENWRKRFSLDLLFAITANMPANSGNISLHTAKLSNENPESITINAAILHGLVAHFHLSFLENTASIKALSAQAIALVASP